MPSIINATTTNGVAISPDNSGSLQLATNNGTTAVTIDTSQNVGVGTTSPASYNSFANQLVVGGSGDKGLTIASGTNNYGSIHFADGTSGADSYRGQIVYYHANNYMSFSTDATERMRINSSGNVGIGTTSPETKLHVTQSNDALPALQLRHGDGDFILMEEGGGTDLFKFTRVAATNDLQINNVTANNIRFATDNTERMRITSGGKLLVNATSPINGDVIVSSQTNAGGASFETNTKTSSDYYPMLMYRNGSFVGNIFQSGSSVAYNTSSDYRLKDNIQPMTGALDKVAQLKPCTYTWKIDGSAGQGFIAHELAEVVPECVTGEKDAVETYIDDEGNEQTRIRPQGIDTSFLVATLTAAIQELKAELDATKAEVQALKGAA